MHIHDVLIIGAGPAGLAAVARLRENTPSATFTDDEHRRYHWIRKHGRKMNIKNYKTHANSLPTPPSTPSNSDCGCACHSSTTSEDMDIVVVDADGGSWMSKWERLFKTFGIDFLRSPMFFHVDPADRDALLGYACEMGREKELLALPGCVGKEVSKHKRKKRAKGKGFLNQTPTVDERDRKDYHAPSARLFEAQCREVVRRYGLDGGMVRQERVVDIEFDEEDAFRDDESDAGDAERKVFRITTNKGVYFSRVAILAVGPGNTPSIPTIPGLPTYPHEGCAHAMHMK